jgi:hypothetical protein
MDFENSGDDWLLRVRGDDPHTVYALAVVIHDVLPAARLLENRPA